MPSCSPVARNYTPVRRGLQAAPFTSTRGSVVAAMVLQKNPGLGQAAVESILKSSALPIPVTGTRNIFDILTTPPAVGSFVNISWDTDCDGAPCDAVGSRLLQVDAAIAATPTP